MNHSNASLKLPAKHGAPAARRSWPLLAAILCAVLAIAIGFRARARAAPALKPLFSQPIKKAVIITINGEIDDVTYSSLRRRVAEAENMGADLIIYRLNTYGGLLTSALNISKFTKGIGIPVVAYVDTKAYSAGSLIATSCRYIVMAPHAAIGDCEPIEIAKGQMHAPSAYVKAKVMSPLLEEFNNSARKNHYDPLLLDGMVLRKLRIEEVRNRLTRKIRYVTPARRAKLLAITAPRPGGGVTHPWTFVTEVKNNRQLLTLDTHTALHYRLARYRVRNPEQLRAVLNIVGSHVPVLRLNWAERLTRWVAKADVRFGLFLVMIVCGYLEFSHPGLVIPGIIALTCLGLLVGAPYLTGLARWWEILIIVLGLGIIVTDFIFYGGIGLLAIPGFLLIAAGIVASFIPSVPGQSIVSAMPQTLSALQTGLSVVVFGTASALVVLLVMARFIPMTPGLRHIAVAPPIPVPAQTQPRNAFNENAMESVFPGAIGVAVSDLRPSGRVKFDQHLVNVISNGQYIRQGAAVQVLEVRGGQAMVKPYTPPPDSSLGTEPLV